MEFIFWKSRKIFHQNNMYICILLRSFRVWTWFTHVCLQSKESATTTKNSLSVSYRAYYTMTVKSKDTTHSYLIRDTYSPNRLVVFLKGSGLHLYIERFMKGEWKIRSTKITFKLGTHNSINDLSLMTTRLRSSIGFLREGCFLGWYLSV